MVQDRKYFDVLILGQGAAAFGAALYAARYRVSTAMFGGLFGAKRPSGVSSKTTPAPRRSMATISC